MAKKKNYIRLMDYKMVFELYEIFNHTRTIYQRLQRGRNKYLELYRNIEKPSESDITIFDLPKEDQDFFYFSFIKEDMLKGVTKSKRRKIEKKLKECQRDKITEGIQTIEERNHSYEHIYSGNHSLDKNISDEIADFMKKSEKERKKAYEEFCEHFTSYFHSEPPTYEDFLLNPVMNVYDYKMARLTSDIPPEDIDNVVLQIVVQVLRERFNLRINYNEIELCLHKLKHLEDDNIGGMSISDFEDEPFPLVFEDYWKMVTDRPKHEHTEENKIQIELEHTHTEEDKIQSEKQYEYTEENKIQSEKEYEDLRKRYIEYNHYNNKLASLKDFYTIDEIDGKSK